MKRKIVRLLCEKGFWRMAYKISPSLAHWYAAVGFAEALQDGLRSDYHE